jgi:hypothetical protein
MLIPDVGVGVFLLASERVINMLCGEGKKLVQQGKWATATAVPHRANPSNDIRSQWSFCQPIFHSALERKALCNILLRKIGRA